MKIYNSFNEMFNAQSGVKSNLSVFNSREYFADFCDEVANGIYNAVDEWYDNLTDERKEQILISIQENGDKSPWQYLSESEWDALYDTNAYREMTDYYQESRHLDEVFEEIADQPFVRDNLESHYGIHYYSKYGPEYWDLDQLKKFYPKDYRRGVIADTIFWLSEYTDMWKYPLDEKIAELQETYWEGKQGKFDFDYE